MKQQVPYFATPEEAEAFLGQDLFGLDFSQFKPMKFEIVKEKVALNVRLSADLMEAVRDKAKEEGMSCARYVRTLLEANVQLKR